MSIEWLRNTEHRIRSCYIIVKSPVKQPYKSIPEAESSSQPVKRVLEKDAVTCNYEAERRSVLFRTAVPCMMAGVAVLIVLK
jgi:hypothetical protein